MVAKLGACRRAFASGVTDVSIVEGRGARDYISAPGTRLRPSGSARQPDRPSGIGEHAWQTTEIKTWRRQDDDRDQHVMALETEHVLQVYSRNPVVFERGQGCRLFDADGRGYLDLLSGIGVASLGHAHPRLARALADQAATLLHTSNLFLHPLQGGARDAPRRISRDCRARSSATAARKRSRRA